MSASILVDLMKNKIVVRNTDELGTDSDLVAQIAAIIAANNIGKAKEEIVNEYGQLISRCPHHIKYSPQEKELVITIR